MIANIKSIELFKSDGCFVRIEGIILNFEATSFELILQAWWSCYKYIFYFRVFSLEIERSKIATS